MGWMQKLIDTYENNSHLVGIAFEGKSTLLPLYHISNKAQIEITIDSNGHFVNASKVLSNNTDTIIPVTEDSTGRSSGIAPHPLCDQLQYICLGLEKYLYKSSEIEDFMIAKEANTLSKNKDLKKKVDKYESYKVMAEKYMEGLGAWVASKYSHLKIRAVYKYCINGSIVSDLIASSVISVDETGRLLEEKIEGSSYEKCLVRWIIYSDDDTNPKTWEDKTLFDSYYNYCNANQDPTKKDICYVTGVEKYIASMHQKGIVRSAYGAKLVSTNDTANYTYRGRFAKWDEAAVIGLEPSQKAHNALSWLVANQGFKMGGRTYVSWNPKGKKIPKASGLFDSFDDITDITTNTMPEYKDKVRDIIKGYRKNLDAHDDVVIMALDAATTGRLSISYYNELRSSDFIDRIQLWHETCCWFFRWPNSESVLVENVMSPITSDIIRCAFGNEKGNFLEVKDEIMKEQSQRIIHCIVDKHLFPQT